MKLPSAAPVKRKELKPVEGLEIGDHVYAKTDVGLQAVRVLARGRDGFTAECEQKKRHKLPWESYLGHRSRMLQNYEVVDQGADGAILEDGRGRRRYLAGEMPEPSAAKPKPAEAHLKDDPLLGGMNRLKKALPMLPDNARIILLKAAVANRPGLSLQAKTDKGGHQTHRWVRAVKDQPSPGKTAAHQDEAHAGLMQHGDTVQFRHGDVAGEGKIVASGRDGVTLQDKDGATHQVRHEHLVKPEGVGAKAETSEKEIGSNGDGGNGGDGGAGSGDGGSGSIPPDKFGAAEFASKFNDPKVTPEDILKNFPPDTAGKIAETNAKLAQLKSTDQEFKVNGEWTPERGALHQKIFDDILSEERVRAAMPAEGEDPTFIILGGRGGSGKSWFNGKVFDPSKFIVLDADEIKQKLPEYEGWNAAQVHEESGDIFDRITERAQALGLNLVHDATMKTAKKAVALVQGFKDAGYRTEAHYMYLPPPEAAKRAVSRFLGKTQRFVPPGIVLDNTTNEGSFDQVKGLVDSWSFRDNNVGKGEEPRLISENGSGAHSRQSGLSGQPSAQSEQLGQGEDSGLDAEADRGAGGPEKGLRKAFDGDARIIFLKAQIPSGAAGDLFPETVAVKGHLRSDGKYVAPYHAQRHKRPDGILRHDAAATADAQGQNPIVEVRQPAEIDRKVNRLAERRDGGPSPDAKHFYVSAVDGAKRYLVAGPYDSHDEAKGHVEHVRKHADEHDPRAHFMAWGTAGSSEPIKTPLGQWRAPA